MNSTFCHYGDADEVRSVYAFEGTEYDNDDVKSVYAFDIPAKTCASYESEYGFFEQSHIQEFDYDDVNTFDNNGYKYRGDPAEAQRIYNEIHRIVFGSDADEVESVYAFEGMACDSDEKDEVESVYAFESVEDVPPEAVVYNKFHDNVCKLGLKLLKAYFAFLCFLGLASMNIDQWTIDHFPWFCPGIRGVVIYIMVFFGLFSHFGTLYYYNQIPESYKLKMSKKSQPIKTSSAKPDVKEVADKNVNAAKN
uniref:Uncharacterized protein n=1 Tax=Panagrellus redivivus TaxID=6233 RepID=A0A7E4V3D5_PANRE